jgi:hypothetical protein
MTQFLIFNHRPLKEKLMNTHMPLSRRGVRKLALMVASGASLVMSMPALAELSPALDRFSISAGVLRADPNINVNLSTAYGNLGTGDVGLGKETMPRIKANIMLFDSQGLSIDFYQYKHSYSGSIGNTTSVNNTPLVTSVNANIDLQLDFGKLAYKWWFGSGNTALGLGAGAAYYKLDLNANAAASLNNSTVATQGSYNDSAVAPLLEFGLRHAISPDVRVFADASGMKKTGGRLNGEIYNAAVGVEWFPVKNVGLVLDYGMTQINLNRLDTVDVNFKFKIQGPSTFVKVRY